MVSPELSVYVHVPEAPSPHRRSIFISDVPFFLPSLFCFRPFFPSLRIAASLQDGTVTTLRGLAGDFCERMDVGKRCTDAESASWREDVYAFRQESFSACLDPCGIPKMKLHRAHVAHDREAGGNFLDGADAGCGAYAECVRAKMRQQGQGVHQVAA